MPHLIVECSSTIELARPEREVLLRLSRRIADSLPCEIHNIKSRFLRRDSFLVGDGTKGDGFVHVELAILPGRSAQQRASMSSLLLAELQAEFAAACETGRTAFTVEMRELDAETYQRVAVSS